MKPTIVYYTLAEIREKLAELGNSKRDLTWEEMRELLWLQVAERDALDGKTVAREELR